MIKINKKMFLIRFFLGLIGIIFTIIIVSDISSKIIAKEYIYNNVNEVPAKKVGMVLGTAKYLQNGNKNLFYEYRIKGTIELYKKGKIDKIIVSGDNSRKDYNEPMTMKKDLIKSGIPEEDIYPDYAGFRTLDSVVRANYIFDINDIIIISQKFHLERALVLAKFRKIKAIGYAVEDVPAYESINVWGREKLARVAMWLDILTNKQPKFFGKKINIE